MPEALLSYLALLGFHPGDEREVLSRAELLEAFALERVGRSGSIFDPDKLRWMNAHVPAPRRRGARAGAGWAAEFLPAGGARAAARRSSSGCSRGCAATSRRWPTWPGELAPFLAERPALEPDGGGGAGRAGRRALCGELGRGARERLRSGARKGLNPRSARRARGSGVKGRELFQPARAALTGRAHGPELPLVAEPARTRALRARGCGRRGRTR